MKLCIVTPRFHPVIGGVEIYLKNIAEYCSKFINTTVISSNLSSTIGLFEKYRYIQKKYDKLTNNARIFRVKTLNNPVLKNLFYFNQFLNKNFEIYLNKSITSNYNKAGLYLVKNNKKLQIWTKLLLFQRKFSNPNFIQIYYFLKNLHKSNPINIVHSAPIHKTSTYYAFQFSKKKNIPFICTPFFHINPYGDYIFYPSFQYILRKSTAIISCTAIEKDFYKKFGINPNKIHIIPPGIDPKRYKKPDTTKFRENYNIPNNAPVLLFMARRTYAKGFFQSIVSLNYLLNRYKEIKLLIAGASTRDYLKVYRKLPHRLKEHIIDLGTIGDQQKVDALNCCDIFLLPSLDDAFGIVYLEAWLFKKPVIGALGGNVQGLIDNGVNGYLVDYRKPKMISSIIEKLIKNKDLRNEIGQNGYMKLIKNFTLDITNKKLLSLYKRLV